MTDPRDIERALDQALARLPPRPAPVALKEQLALLAAAPKVSVTGSARKRPTWPWLAAALSLAAVMTAGLLIVRRPAGSDAMVAEAVNDHLRVLYAQHPLEVESGGIHQVKPWFEGRLDFAPSIAFEGNADFVLTGGSVGYFIDRKAAIFIYRHRLHVMTLFVFRADGLPWTRLTNESLGRVRALQTASRGFRVLLFRDGDLGYAIVSDTEPATVQKLGAEVVRAAATVGQ